MIPLFIWDPSDGFGANLGHVKHWWLRESLNNLHRDLQKLGAQLYTRTGQSTQELRSFLTETGADAVFWNRCYEPELLTRDEKLRNELAQEGLTAESFKAELLVEPWELSNTQLAPCFATFHEYMRAWMTLPPPPQPLPCPSRLKSIKTTVKNTQIDKLGFDIPSNVEDSLSKVWTPGSQNAHLQLDRFLNEVFPAFGDGRCRRHFDGTSKLSPHVRFGEISPRRMYHTTRLRVWRWKDQSSASISKPVMLSKVKASMPSSSALLSNQPHPSIPVHENGFVSVMHVERDEKMDNLREQEIPSQKKFDRSAQAENYDSSRQRRSPSYQPCNPLKEKKRSGLLPPISMSARAFLKNLCLRDFSYHVLFHNPDVNSSPLIPEFSHFPWAEDNGSFESWQHGKTGYPIVDAAMRELRETGWIHNGMRFLLACFLAKYLLLPWSRGLKEFYQLLIDGDRSANALGWQWTAGCNSDAFPLSCLVNPVKVAVRHDPNGSYIRRWVPELAKVPTEYLHQPWKAPSDVLKGAGVRFGINYPNRIVNITDARRRALDAMKVMKQIFMGSSIFRSIYSRKVEDLITEWPAEDTEILPIDESPFLGKKGLVPSLWALLQNEQSAAYLSGPLSGNDPIIAMDTANLTEGALAVPLDENHESIEHALITGHEGGSSFAGAFSGLEAGERAFSLLSNGKHNDSRPALHAGVESENDNVEQFEESLEYGGEDDPRFSEPDKRMPQFFTNTPPLGRIRPESLHVSQEVYHGPLDGSPYMNNNSGQTSGSQAMAQDMTPTTCQQSHQQIQNFQQLQMQHFHQYQHFQQLQQQQQDQHHIRQHRQQSVFHGRPPHTAPQAPIHSMMDGGGYTSPSNMMLSNPVAGVSMNPSGVMMGAGTNGSDVGVGQIFPGSNVGNGIYAPQFGMSPIYAYPPVVPVAHPHAVRGVERAEVVGASSNGSRGKIPPSGILPVGYGLYGSNVLESTAVGNSFPLNGASYRSLSVSSQQPTHLGSQSHYGFSPHAMYIPQPHTDVLQNQGRTNFASSNAVHRDGSRAGGIGTMSGPADNVAAATAVAAGEREMPVNAIASSQDHAVRTLNQPAGPKPKSDSSKHGGIDVDGNKVAKSLNGNGASRADSQCNGRSASKSKATSRSRRGMNSSAGPRSKGEGMGHSTSRGRSSHGGASVTHPRGRGDNTAISEITLENRRKILSSVLGEKDHEYYNFANFLARTCELTGNTDRQTSKDYIRLCNLKDDFHRQCNSEEEKLKIYRIKGFFSKVLKLEVTGEWDRHNHGGVRGPYVYGIRMRKPPQDPSADTAPN